MKTLLLLELPPPTHGVTYINQIIYQSFNKKEGLDIVETNYTDTLSEVGGYSASKLIRNFKIAFCCWKAYLTIRPKIVYSTLSATKYGISRDFLMLLPAIILKEKKVLHLHGFTYFKIYNESKFYRCLLNIIKINTEFIVLGTSHEKEASKVLNINTIIVENCINSTPKQVLRNIDNTKTKRLLYISNVSKAKGTFDLIESIKNMDNISLTIAGGILEDKREFLQLIQGVENVHYIGFADEKRKQKLFETHHIFCLPSKLEEGSPISIIEALSQSLPVLATAKGCIPEMIDGCGYLLKEQNRLLDIQLGIGHIIENYDEFSVNAYARFISRYSKESFVEKLEKVLC
jgi:glycosyltransferase involved in cell wall biosynthesis